EGLGRLGSLGEFGVPNVQADSVVDVVLDLVLHLEVALRQGNPAAAAWRPVGTAFRPNVVQRVGAAILERDQVVEFAFLLRSRIMGRARDVIVGVPLLFVFLARRLVALGARRPTLVADRAGDVGLRNGGIGGARGQGVIGIHLVRAGAACLRAGDRRAHRDE